MTVAKPRLFTRDFILVTLVGMITGIYSLMQMTTVLLYGDHIGLSSSSAGALTSSFAFASLFFRPFTGLLADRLPTKPLYLFSLGLFALCPLLLASLHSYSCLIVIRILQGFAMSVASTLNGTVSTSIVPPSRLNEGIGYFGIGMTLSSSVAPALGLFLIERFGYDGMFFFCALIGLAALLMTCFLDPRPAEGGSGGIRLTPNRFFTGLFEKSSFFPSFLLLLLTFSQVSITQILPGIAGEDLSGRLSSFFVVASVFTVLARLFAGQVRSHRAVFRSMALGLSSYAAALFLIQIGGPRSTYFLPIACLYGAANGSTQLLLNTMAVENSPPERLGAANSTYLAASDLGYGLAPIAWGFYTQSLGSENMLWTAGGLCLLVLLLYCRHSAVPKIS